MRSVFKTILGIPQGYTKKIHIAMDAPSLFPALLNMITLLLLVSVDDAQSAAGDIIHLWYSVRIHRELHDFCNNQVQRYIQGGLTAPSDSVPWAVNAPYGNRGGTVQSVMRMPNWRELQKFLAAKFVPDALAAERSRFHRNYDAERRDWLSMERLRHRRSRRVSKDLYRSEGMLLPFGASRGPFRWYNP